MSKLAYTIFLAIATAKEFSIIFDLGGNFLIGLIYLILFFILVIKLINNSLQPWVWKDGFGIVGLSSLVYLVLAILGLEDPILEKFHAIICLYVWIKSMRYLNNYKSWESF